MLTKINNWKALLVSIFRRYFEIKYTHRYVNFFFFFFFWRRRSDGLLTFLSRKICISCWRYRVRYLTNRKCLIFFVLVFVNWKIETNRVWHDTLVRRNDLYIRRFCCIEPMLEDIVNHRRIGIGQRRTEILLLWQRRIVKKNFRLKGIFIQNCSLVGRKNQWKKS